MFSVWLSARDFYVLYRSTHFTPLYQKTICPSTILSSKPSMSIFVQNSKFILLNIFQLFGPYRTITILVKSINVLEDTFHAKARVGTGQKYMQQINITVTDSKHNNRFTPDIWFDLRHSLNLNYVLFTFVNFSERRLSLLFVLPLI